MLPADPKRLNHLAASASIAVALILIAAKLGAWLITDSIVILTALVDSGIDLLASLVTLFSVRQAAQPADRAHRYGHGKAEALGAFTQAGFVGGSALILASEAIQRLISPQPISQGRLGIAVMLLAIALTGALVLFQRAVVRRTGSVAIRADSLHYRGDLLMNLAVIASLLLTEADRLAPDRPAARAGDRRLLLYGAAGVARHALDMLMDRELPASAGHTSARWRSPTPRRMASTTCAPGGPGPTCSSSSTWSSTASSAWTRRTTSRRGRGADPRGLPRRRHPRPPGAGRARRRAPRPQDRRGRALSATLFAIAL